MQQPPHLAQPRLEEAEVVVEGVAVGGLLEQLGRVAAAAEAGAVAGAVGGRGGDERAPRLVAPGVERRVEVGHLHALVRLGAHQLEVVAEQHPVHDG